MKTVTLGALEWAATQITPYKDALEKEINGTFDSECIYCYFSLHVCFFGMKNMYSAVMCSELLKIHFPRQISNCFRFMYTTCICILVYI